MEQNKPYVDQLTALGMSQHDAEVVVKVLIYVYHECGGTVSFDNAFDFLKNEYREKVKIKPEQLRTALQNQ